MLFLILLIPMTLLGAVLTTICWRARQRRVALVMAGIALACAGVSAVLLFAGLFLCDALQRSTAG